MLCRIDGCRQKRGRYALLCSHHRHVERTRGHPEQRPLFDTHLAQYRKRIARHLVGPHADTMRAVFKERWLDFIAECSATIHEAEVGPFVKNHLEAALEVRGLAETADPEKTFETLTALFLLAQYEPAFFKDHDAFAVNVQRFLRREAAGAYDLVWNATDQRYARKLRGLKHKAARTLGHWIISAFAGSCGLLAVSIYNEEHRQQEQARQFREALSDLTTEWRANVARKPRRHQTPKTKLPFPVGEREHTNEAN